MDVENMGAGPTFWDDVLMAWSKKIDPTLIQQKNQFVNGLSKDIGKIPDTLMSDEIDEDIEDF